MCKILLKKALFKIFIIFSIFISSAVAIDGHINQGGYNYNPSVIFNWDNLLNNDDNAILCKTSFVFHFKGISFNKAGIKYSNNLKEHLEQRENKFNTTGKE